MASTNVYSIPLYNKGFLSAIGYREGCGYNAKIFWGAEQLASRPSLEDAVVTAYIGARLYSPKFHSWMTHDIRVQILDELEKMSNLIFPSKICADNESLLKILKSGMSWHLNNTLKIEVGEDVVDPVKTIEIIKNDFMKASRLSVTIRLLNDFKNNPKEDMLSVSLGEQTPKQTLHMCVTEDNLPIHLFGNQWIENAVNSFNQFRRFSAQGQPYEVHGTLKEMAEQTLGTVINPSKWIGGAATNLRASFDLGSKTGDFSLNLNGNVMSLTGDTFTISAPKINTDLNNVSGYARARETSDVDEPALSEFGKMIRKAGFKYAIELDKNIPTYLVQAYAEMPYIDPDTKMPMPLLKFIDDAMKWDYLKTDYETWSQSSGFNGDKSNERDLVVWKIMELALQLKTNAEVAVPCGDGVFRKVKSFYFEPKDQKQNSHSTFLP